MKDILRDSISNAIKKYKEETIQNRRHLHMNPEIGFDTKETEGFIINKLKEYGIEILPSKIGFLAKISGKTDEYIALRSDIDALPLHEENDVPYASKKENMMHACGHDAHTAILLTTARIIKENQDSLNESILLIFQPAEEGPNLGGARLIVKELQENGMINKIKCMYGLHVFNNYPLGSIEIRYGGMMASTDEFDIEIIGSAGHAGEPQNTVDAVSIIAKVIGGIETWMSRRMNPLDQGICSIGMVRGGTAKNIVAETASISGTIRCLKNETRDKIIDAITSISENFAKAYGATARINILRGLPPLTNDDEVTRNAEEVLRKNLKDCKIDRMEEPVMGAEDFAFYAQEIPSTFIHIGSKNEEKGLYHLAHTPKFDIDEDAMDIGIKVFCNLIFQDK